MYIYVYIHRFLLICFFLQTGNEELALRADRRKYTRAQALLGAAGAIVDTVKAD